MPEPVVIVELEQTCGMCPSQWEGRLDDGRHIYIRFRHGCLSAGAGTTDDEALDSSHGWDGKEPWFYMEPDTGHPDDGYMTTEEMLKWTGFTLKGGATA